MRRVIIESPFAGDVEANIIYARRCVSDSLSRGEAPLASHLLYPQVLDDLTPAQRSLGILAGLAWHEVAQCVVFYVDRDWSPGMCRAFGHAMQKGIPYEIRKLESEIAVAAIGDDLQSIDASGALERSADP